MFCLQISGEFYHELHSSRTVIKNGLYTNSHVDVHD